MQQKLGHEVDYDRLTRLDRTLPDEAEEGQVKGIYRRSIALTSGRFAVIDGERQFTLVPWRAVLERHRGREIAGIVQGVGVSWQFGIQRDRGISRRACCRNAGR